MWRTSTAARSLLLLRRPAPVLSVSVPSRALAVSSTPFSAFIRDVKPSSLSPPPSPGEERVEEDEEVEIQPHWKSMESRVVKRPLVRATEESRRRGARGRVPASEEDHWSRAGVYSSAATSSESSPRSDQFDPQK